MANIAEVEQLLDRIAELLKQSRVRQAGTSVQDPSFESQYRAALYGAQRVLKAYWSQAQLRGHPGARDFGGPRCGVG